MSLFSKIKGTIETVWQIGIGGPLFKNQSNAALDLRNSADNAYLPLRIADPNSEDSATTKRWVDSKLGVVLISGQADCTSTLGNNTGSVGYYVVTTAGTGAILGNLLYDNGSSTGTRTIVASAVRAIAIPVAYSGGTIAFDADSIYLWDVEGGVWVKIGDIGSVTGSLRVIRKVIGTSGANQDTTFQFPANSRVYRVRAEFTTPYNSGVTLSVGYVGSSSAFMATTENLPQSSDAFENAIDVSVGASAVAMRCTLGGTLSSGAGVVTTWFSVPN